MAQAHAIGSQLTASRDRAGYAAQKLQRIGGFILRYGLVFVLVFWGMAKFTKDEAEGVQPLMAHSPLLSWTYHLMTVQHASDFIGVIELTLALLIVVRRWAPKLSAVGSAASIVMFLVTLSFLLTTPGLDAGTQGFLIKDIFLLGAAVWSTGEAWQAVS